MDGTPGMSWLNIDTTHLSTVDRRERLEVLRKRYDALLEDNLTGIVCAGVDPKDIHLVTHQGKPKITIFVKDEPIMTIEAAISEDKVEFREIPHTSPRVNG